MNRTFKDFLEDMTLNEMSKTIKPDVSGLPKSVWIGKPEQHGPRIKIVLDKSTKGRTITVKLNKDADLIDSHEKYKDFTDKEIKDVQRWVRYNLEVLLDMHIAIEEGGAKLTEELDNLLLRIVPIRKIPKDV